MWYEIAASLGLMQGIIEKGSIAIDGISLTVAGVSGSGFSVSIIPHTAGHTTLLEKKAGDVVNLETDCIGKYVRHLLGLDEAGKMEAGSGSGITREFLAAQGFFR